MTRLANELFEIVAESSTVFYNLFLQLVSQGFQLLLTGSCLTMALRDKLHSVTAPYTSIGDLVWKETVCYVGGKVKH